MATKRLAGSIGSQRTPQTQMRSAKIIDILSPATSEDDLVTGWQVLIEFDGGEVSKAGVASTYKPIPGDYVAVARYLNTLFVIDKVAGGDSGIEPGNRVGYKYTTGAGTYLSVVGAAELALPELTITVPMRNLAAYVVRLSTGFGSNVANQWAMFRLRQDTVAGADIGEWYRRATAVAGVIYGFEGSMLVRNDSGFDLDVTIVPTLTGPAGATTTAFATAQTRAYIEVFVEGSSKLYPHAATVTAPADLT